MPYLWPFQPSPEYASIRFCSRFILIRRYLSLLCRREASSRSTLFLRFFFLLLLLSFWVFASSSISLPSFLEPREILPPWGFNELVFCDGFPLVLWVLILMIKFLFFLGSSTLCARDFGFNLYFFTWDFGLLVLNFNDEHGFNLVCTVEFLCFLDPLMLTFFLLSRILIYDAPTLKSKHKSIKLIHYQAKIQSKKSNSRIDFNNKRNDNSPA